MVLAAVEARFRGYRAPYQVEILSENGSPYIARNTRIFVRQLGLKPCYTRMKSPQSNGISEAFVNTLKRDYVNIAPLPHVVTILGLIAGWFEAYNKNQPHLGLKMHSLRKHIVPQTATA